MNLSDSSGFFLDMVGEEFRTESWKHVRLDVSDHWPTIGDHDVLSRFCCRTLWKGALVLLWSD